MQLNKNIFIFLTLGVTAALILLKRNTLGIPFFWDEAWVYGPALKNMGGHLCFLPACADELTRGHPLLFHFTGGLWVVIFGDSLFSLHCFSLTVSIILQWTCFYIGKKIFNNFFGFVFSTLVFSQNMIFSQSTLVLPEIFLAVFCLWTFYFFYRKNKTGYFIFGSLLCLVKEQGVVLIAALTVWNLFDICREAGIKKMFSAAAVKQTIFFLLPITLLFLFLCLQKMQKGYFFLPEHINILKTNFEDVEYQFQIASKDVFSFAGRNFISVVFLLSFLIAGRIRPSATRMVLLVMLLILIKIAFGRWGFHSWISILIIPPFFSLLFYRIFIVADDNPAANKIQGICFFFLLFYLIFCAVNFFTNRYLICVIPFFLLFILAEIFYNFEKNKMIRTLVVSSMILFSCFSLYNLKGFAECSPGYYQAVLLQKEMIDFGVKNGLKEKRLLASFVMLNNMVKPEAGFVKQGDSFSHVGNVFSKEDKLPEYIFDTNIDRDPSFLRLLGGTDYVLEKEFKVGEAEGKIYRLKN